MYCVVYVTVASEAEADRLARCLVQEHLVACANQLAPVRSTYRWEGQIQQDTEVLLILKTRRDLMPALMARVQQLHTYALPEVIALPIVEGLPDYLSWIHHSTQGPDL